MKDCPSCGHVQQVPASPRRVVRVATAAMIAISGFVATGIFVSQPSEKPASVSEAFQRGFNEAENHFLQNPTVEPDEWFCQVFAEGEVVKDNYEQYFTGCMTFFYDELNLEMRSLEIPEKYSRPQATPSISANADEVNAEPKVTPSPNWTGESKAQPPKNAGSSEPEAQPQEEAWVSQLRTMRANTVASETVLQQDCLDLQNGYNAGKYLYEGGEKNWVYLRLVYHREERQFLSAKMFSLLERDGVVEYFLNSRDDAWPSPQTLLTSVQVLCLGAGVTIAPEYDSSN